MYLLIDGRKINKPEKLKMPYENDFADSGLLHIEISWKEFSRPALYSR